MLGTAADVNPAAWPSGVHQLLDTWPTSVEGKWTLELSCEALVDPQQLVLTVPALVPDDVVVWDDTPLCEKEATADVDFGLDGLAGDTAVDAALAVYVLQSEVVASVGVADGRLELRPASSSYFAHVYSGCWTFDSGATLCDGFCEGSAVHAAP